MLRTQLHHAYQKLGLHDRSDLFRLLTSYGFNLSGKLFGEDM
jgi:hypothetical protein